jgi:hypothetical protein
MKLIPANYGVVRAQQAAEAMVSLLDDKTQYFVSSPTPQSAQNVQGLLGTGLGLSIVQETTNMLGGDIRIDSSEDRGSTFTVTIPTSRLVLDSLNKTSESLSRRSRTPELPELDTSIFTPSRWKTGDAIRDQRCAEMLRESLIRGLSRWFQVKVIPWGLTSTSPRPRLFLILQEDIEDAKQTCGEIFDLTKHIVLHSDVQTTSSASKMLSENFQNYRMR